MHLTAEGNKYAAFRKNKVEEVLYFFLLEGTIDDLADKKEIKITRAKTDRDVSPLETFLLSACCKHLRISDAIYKLGFKSINYLKLSFKNKSLRRKISE